MTQENEEGDPSLKEEPRAGTTYVVKWVDHSGRQQRSQLIKDKLVATVWVEALSEMFAGQPAWMEKVTPDGNDGPAVDQPVVTNPSV